VFAVHLGKTHGKLVCLPCASEKRTAKFFLKNPHFICLKRGRGENVVCEKTHGKQNLCCAFFFRAHGKELICRAFFLCCALYIKRTANKLFAVCPKKNTRQRFWRTANTGFPVVDYGRFNKAESA
jgi:hypothetical protein